jgi:hypothetical protein
MVIPLALLFSVKALERRVLKLSAWLARASGGDRRPKGALIGSDFEPHREGRGDFLPASCQFHSISTAQQDFEFLPIAMKMQFFSSPKCLPQSDRSRAVVDGFSALHHR